VINILLGLVATTAIGRPAYNATKHADGGNECLSQYRGVRNGVRACVIYPGEVATPILASRPVPPSAEGSAEDAAAEDIGRTVRFSRSNQRTCA